MLKGKTSALWMFSWVENYTATFGNNFQFHSNLYYKLKTKFLLPEFYKNTLSNWTV